MLRVVCTGMKLSVQTFLTLDGVMQAPGGPEEDPSDGVAHGGWQAPRLLGRPDRPADPFARAINTLPKHLVSRSLGEADAAWRGRTRTPRTS